MTTTSPLRPETTEGESPAHSAEGHPGRPWVSPPADWPIGDLKSAVPLYLGLRAATPDAIALVDA